MTGSGLSYKMWNISQKKMLILKENENAKKCEIKMKRK